MAAVWPWGDERLQDLHVDKLADVIAGHFAKQR